MDRVSMCNRIGNEYKTSNIEGGEYSYVQAAGSKEKLVQAIGYEPEHFKLDIRFEHNGVVVLVETKQNFTDADEKQLREYLFEERMLHYAKKIICILANTNNDKIKVWKSEMDDDHLLKDETVLDTMEHYVSLFEVNRQNNREAVLKNTYALNETLHRKDIDETLRSQFVGTTLLYLRDVLKKQGITVITPEARQKLKDYWGGLSANLIRSSIGETLSNLLDGSDNKTLKIELLQRNVINNQKVKKLALKDWIEVLDEIVNNIYRYINEDSSEGQDILNLFFIAFNKYTGKADKNQAFTPDHITNFMCRATGVDRTKRVFDGTCGSGSFLVQAMVLELIDCNRQRATEAEKQAMREKVAKEHIYGIEIEEKAFGLSTTNMLIHGDGNSNINHASLFDSEQFFRQANPDIILMNPPYNAKPITIPAAYKTGWKSDAKEDPTKGMVFLKFISDVVVKMNKERLAAGKPKKEVKVAILLPVSAAIGTSNFVSEMKTIILEENTLDAVFTLPNEVFYPGASVTACCMVFTLGRPHVMADGTIPKTFFGYYKDDGHKKKKNLGRIEQFDKDNNSIWKQIEEEWLDLFRNKTVKDGMSAMQAVTGDDEWLCEAYMKTDYSKLSEADFQKTLNDYCGYLVKAGKFPYLVANKGVTPALNVSEWKEYRVGDFFDIHPTKTIDGVSADDCVGYGAPLVVNSAENNGVAGMCDLIPTEEGGIITFSDTTDGNTFFYQPDFFIGFAHVQGMYPKTRDWNAFELLFFKTMLAFDARGRYNYGRKMRRDTIAEVMIKLPITTDGDPDWQFMENYIKALPYGDRLADEAVV
ncbi:MAG: N-6 DNA methylase [Clostridia bacterium]|nr:N-6 DNA methylase [Clostridia bacterium]